MKKLYMLIVFVQCIVLIILVFSVQGLLWLLVVPFLVIGDFSKEIGLGLVFNIIAYLSYLVFLSSFLYAPYRALEGINNKGEFRFYFTLLGSSVYFLFYIFCILQGEKLLPIVIFGSLFFVVHSSILYECYVALKRLNDTGSFQ